MFVGVSDLEINIVDCCINSLDENNSSFARAVAKPISKEWGHIPCWKI